LDNQLVSIQNFDRKSMAICRRHRLRQT